MAAKKAGAATDGGVGVSAAYRRQIESALKAIERREGVRVLLAIESGSRAWGFASPDSDYDVRFLYVRPASWYLSIQSRRDVIEQPITSELDVSGWDIRKALALLCKPNPVLLEWMESPIVYRMDRAALARLREIAALTLSRPAQYRHYWHLGQQQMRRVIEKHDEVALKKYFYLIRPAATLAWMRAHRDKRVPMDLPSLLDGIKLPRGVAAAIEDLLARKRKTSELGIGPRVPVLDAWLDREFARAEPMASRPLRMVPAAIEAADALFQRLVRSAKS